MAFMFVFAGIALLRASSPVLGTFVSGEYRTACAGVADRDSHPNIGTGEAIWTKTRTEAIRPSSFFNPSSEAEVKGLYRLSAGTSSPCKTELYFIKKGPFPRENRRSSTLINDNYDKT